MDRRINEEINGLKFLYQIATILRNTELLHSYSAHKKNVNKKIAEINVPNSTKKINSSVNRNKMLWQIFNKRYPPYFELVYNSSTKQHYILLLSSYNSRDFRDHYEHGKYDIKRN